MRVPKDSVNFLLECFYIQLLMAGPDEDSEELLPIDLDSMLEQCVKWAGLPNQEDADIAELAQDAMWTLHMLVRAHSLIHQIVNDYKDMRALALEAVYNLPNFMPQKTVIHRRILNMRGVEADTDVN